MSTGTIDGQTQQLIGEMNANIKTLMARTEAMQKQLDGVVAMTNRWKGATTLLIAAGGFIGWIANIFFRSHQ